MSETAAVNTPESKYKIKAGTFEGPMDLLMYLLEKNKVDIYDIPIAEITAQYLEHLESLKAFDIEVASEFLVMATLLLHIKASLLLPQVKKDGEAEDLSDDPRDILVEKIIEYKKIQKYAKALEKVFVQAGKYTPREPVDLSEEFLKTYDAEILSGSLIKLLGRIQEAQTMRYIDVEELSIQEAMQAVRRRLRTGGRKLFTDLLDSDSTEMLVVCFLAVLELLKQGVVEVYQEDIFAPIYIELRGKNV